MKKFLEWLKDAKIQEQIATQSFVGSNIINNDNNDDDDGDGDKNWEWDGLKKYDKNLINWASIDPFAKRIKNAIIELIFKDEPKMEISEYFGDGQLPTP